MNQLCLTLSCVLFCVACSASPRINVGNEPDGSFAGTGGGAAGVAGTGVGGFGGGDNTLTALISEPPSEIGIEVVTISCAGECKQVLAIARGGNDPYTFTWNDGVTTAAREICADDDTSFTVTVNDTAVVDGEFPYASQTATATVIADVLDCSDAGVDAGEPLPDAGEDVPPVECSPDLVNDPTCEVLARGTDCPGTVMYDLAQPVEAGGTLCITLTLSGALVLAGEIKAGVGCNLESRGQVFTGLSTAGLWQICSEEVSRVERFGISGVDPSFVSVRHCPNCDG